MNTSAPPPPAVSKNEAALSDLVRTTIQLGGAPVEACEIDVDSASAMLSRLVQALASPGCVVRIRPAHEPDADGALLMSPRTFEQMAFPQTRRRTLGEVIAALPFKTTGIGRLHVSTPDNTVRTLCVPASGR